MAVLLSRDWTAADGTLWTAVGFRKILGGAGDAIVTGNQGRPGAIAADRTYAVTGMPQTPNHKLQVDAIWANAAGANRTAALGVRWNQEDPFHGYRAEVDSNTGSARARIQRYVGGVLTDLTGWVDIAALGITAAMLNAGVTLELRVENQEGQVNLRLKVNSTVCITLNDNAAARLEGDGLPVLRLDGNTSGSDLTFDNLFVKDFEDEYAGDPLELDEDTALVVDGTYHSWSDLEDAGIVVGAGRQSYTHGDGWEFRTTQLMDAADTILYPGAVVVVSYGGTVLARGRIQAASREIQPKEGRVYELVPARELAADVVLRHPDTGANTIVWDLPKDHAEYDADFDDTEVGEAILELLEEVLDGDDGLRAHLAAPPDEGTSICVQAELDAMTAKVPGMSASGDPVQGVEQLLAYTKYALFIDPVTLQWRFRDRTAGAIIQINRSSTHTIGEYRIDPKRNKTAGEITGARPELTERTLDNGVVLADGKAAVGGLTGQWETALESTHDSSKAVKNKDNGLVSSIGGTVNAPTMTPNPVGPPAFSMEALEWKKGLVSFVNGPEAGEAYDVTTNTGLAFTLVGPWRNGGPAVGNMFIVSGNAANGGRDNGHVEMGRRYELDNVDYAIAEDECAHVRIRTDKLDLTTIAKIEIPTDLGEKSTLRLDLPSIGLVNTTGDTNGDPCTPGDTPTQEARVEITLKTYSRGTPEVPRLRVPASGFRGTAFTTDSSKWNGAGTWGKGDPARMAVEQLAIPEYDGSASMAAELTKVLDEVLAFLSPLCRSLTVRIPGIDTQWAGLGKRLQFVGGPPELATITDLTVLAVEWDVPANRTTIYAGTLVAGPYDMQAMRAEMMSRHVRRREKVDATNWQKLLDCLSKNQHSAGYAHADPPTQICGTKVSIGGGKTVADALGDQCTSDVINAAASCTPNCGTASAGDLLALRNAAAALGGREVKGSNIIDEMCCNHEVTNYIGQWLYSWAHAVDGELGKGKGDITELKDCYEALKAKFNSLVAAHNTLAGTVAALILCVNAGWAAIRTCFAGKADGLGSSCTIDDCAGATPTGTTESCTPTPEMCDPVCAMSAPSPTPCAP